MSLLTDFLKLFKWDTTSETDLDEEFDIDTSMNGNWDILDTKAKEHDDKINTLEEVQAEQDSLIQKLKDNMINLSTEEATSLYITDAGTPPASLKIMGNHRQNGTPTLENPVEIETVKDEVNVIVCNSNFLKKQEQTTVTANGITANVTEDGTVVLNGTTQYATYVQIASELKIGRYNDGLNFEKYVLPRGNYKFISETGGQTSANVHAYLRESPANLNFDVNIPSINSATKKETTFEIENKQQYMSYLWIASGTTLTDFTMKFMLKRSDDTTEYVQNEQQKITLDLQQEMLEGDYFDLENDKEVHTWKKVEKTNVSEFTVTKTDNTFKFYFKVSNANNSSTILNKLFKNYKNSFSNTGTVMEWNGNLNVIFKFGDCGFTESMTVEEAKTRFQEIIDENTSLVFYYSMTTTEELALTQTQKQQLAQLDNLDLYRGINNIYSEEGIALMQLDYSADTKQTVDSLNDRITALEQQLLNTAESEG